MSGGEILSALVHSAAVIVLWRALLHKEPQYTLLSWLALLGIIANMVGLGITIS